ncbi:DUF2339 domain-containing protein [Rhodovulum adriaticum]|uniref:Putative membrane protein n=1 Tax=Rhodovulum adriaticum TaxID=35804 RepID=A0A4R2NYR3_RHOAD|nr:DUF2339 domain-containing protein [Rhodovulum adriaticum]MBK1634192.1 hypothetical protein [Rhodovulum adriaticum]TCP27257.1 putative membrane protein [Rhodovulum adriaticum]
MEGLALLALLFVAYVAVTPLIAVIMVRRANRRADALADRLMRLERKLDDLRDRNAQAPPEPAPTMPEAEPAAAVDAAEVITAPVREDAAVDDTDTDAQGAAAPGPWDAPEPPEPAPAEHRPNIEETLASKWMIWLGAIAVALSAVFLFRYAIDAGWLTPMARVIAGLMLGGALLGAGEWAARRPVPGIGRAMNTDYVPPALTASGIFAIYAALYAAHGLYGLLGPGTAFVALGLVAYAALGLALRQGWFVALLGLAGGYLMPALIDSPQPQALPLFLYLWALGAGCLAVMVWQRWWWFAVLTLTGALAWPLLWLATNWTIADQGVLGGYALGLAALFAGLSTRLPVKDPQTPAWRWLSAMLADTSGLGFTLSGLLLLMLADASGYNGAAFAFVGFYGALALAMAAWRPALEGLTVAAAAIAVAAFLIWPVPAVLTIPEEMRQLGMGSLGVAFGPFLMPVEFHVFARALWGLAALFGIGAGLGLARGRTVALWAGLSAAMPTILFAIAYWRIGAFRIDIDWAFVGMGLAALMLGAATMVARRMTRRRRDVALALYAAGCTAAIALAVTCVLREAWLTVALAAEVLALAWIWDRLRVREVKAIALIMACIVLVRLVANPAILDYEGGIAGLLGWVIYGYGLPAAAMIGAARLFARGAGGTRDPLVLICEVLGLGFGFLMVAFQLKLWTSGTLSPMGWNLFDSAVQVLWWLTAAALCLRRAWTAARPWLVYAGGLLLLAAGLVVGLGHVIDLNPLFTAEPVGRWPLVNLLGLAYLAPALIFALLAARPGFDLGPASRQWLWAGAGVLLFLDLTLETRRAFHGSVIALGTERMPTNGEIYAYSAVWIVFALVLLAIGIRRNTQAARYASLAVLIVTVVKVFLYDMSDLTGLYRVASFLGLGLTLIGIGRVYQRHVCQPAPRQAQAGDAHNT